MIKVENLYKLFDNEEVLQDINMSFEQGKINMIIGQSGSGKSVLTKCIVGLLTPTKGKVLFDDKDFHSLNRSQKKRIRKQLGMLFQSSALFDSLTVEDNVLFPLKMFAEEKKENMKKRADYCLERVNLKSSNKLFPDEISGGMKKRVAIARAIAMNPSYLFCDEPNSGLDPQTSILIDKLIQEITYENNITTIVITHDMNSVMEIADKIMFIYSGKKWWEGNRDEIMNTDNPEMNDFVYASEFMKSLKGKI